MIHGRESGLVFCASSNTPTADVLEHKYAFDMTFRTPKFYVNNSLKRIPS